MSSRRNKSAKDRRAAWAGKQDPAGEPPVTTEAPPADPPPVQVTTESPAPASVPDAANIGIADLPHTPLPPITGQRGARFQPIVRQSVIDDIRAHALATPEVEICGVLLGDLYSDGTAPYLHVRASIRGQHAANAGGHVTFTAATWQQIQADVDRLYPDLRMVGWYHSHPGFGIFLSEMDVFIQKNFFDLPWQVAYVCDPIGKSEGLFVWHGGVPTEEEFLVEPESNPMPPTGAIAATGSHAPAPAAVVHPLLEKQVESLTLRVKRLERRQTGLMAVLLFAILLLLVWPMVVQTMFSDNSKPPAASNPAFQNDTP